MVEAWPPSLEQTLREGAQKLAPVSPSARLDSEVLVMHVCQLSRTELITRGQESLTTEQARRLQDLLARRLQGEPIAYLTGQREFWSVDLDVNVDVLIPRPETELLVEQALARIPRDVSWALADLGTGSGAIALALAQERPDCQILATDISSAALTVAEANARRLQRINLEFRTGDWTAPLAGMKFDLIVSNPPYISASDPHLSQGDVRFEPRLALVSGADGLDAIRQIIAEAAPHLRSPGWLLLEHGYDQAMAVRALFAQYSYREIISYRDTLGHERVTAACLVSPKESL